MGKYDKYYDAQNYIIDIVKTEMIGPTTAEEVLDSPPLNTYVAGILWAKPLARTNKTDDEVDYETNQSLNDVVSEITDDEMAVPEELTIEDSSSDGVISKSAVRKPSTMGVSVILDRDVHTVEVKFDFGKYVHSVEEREYGENGETRPYYLYKRQQHSVNLKFDFTENKSVYHAINNNCLDEYNISIRATKRLGNPGEKRLVTFSVSNDTESPSKDIILNESALFQCLLSLKTIDGNFAPMTPEFSTVFDIEDEVLAMQYRKILNYSQGHGCATSFDVHDNVCNCIRSEFIPVHEVKQMKPPSVNDEHLFDLEYLYSGNKAEIISRIKQFVSLYSDWAIKEENLSKTTEFKPYYRAACACIKKINICIKRITAGVHLLEHNENVWKAFVLCNKAMYLQRVSMALSKNKIANEEEFKEKMQQPSWYPFQLFYLIMIIPDFSDEGSDFKDVVDLLWFPTGGGKTEAYLAVSAFVIFYERIVNRRTKYGTTILMRYTLRLLTVQQFQRASALICSCEKIRISENLGGNEISIGLWIGGGSAPNTIDDAKKALDRLLSGGQLYELSNPVQITKCPYCGCELDATNYHIKDDKMEIVCNKCGHLPIYIVDSDIYEQSPTLIISTVDKFARIVWDERTGKIFGCNENTNKPRLIIQDELHLISGPLGTLTGLYEAAIDRLCWTESGEKPKIIASTATVKNAAYQIKGLYDRPHFQFPPSGLNYDNSFFAVQATKDDKPSRFYVGLSEQGGSMVDLMIRTFSALCLADYYLLYKGADDSVVDQFYTIIGYFNAIKDLGNASTTIRERMYSHITSLLNGKFLEESKKANVPVLETEDHTKKTYLYDERIRNDELTSRNNSTQIKRILDKLDVAYKKDNNDELPYKYVLSSNMFSVGVDIDRLGAMVVYGQPKSNSDYIQATSRVGRSNPGIVFSMYNAFRSRDRSYYEDFNQYHSCFYKYVESTSVTPFSTRSIEKGLHAVFIALVRHLIPNMESNASAKNYNDALADVNKLKEYLYGRVKDIQPASLPYAIAFLNDFSSYWSTKKTKMVYDSKKMGKYASQYISLLVPAENGTGEFSILNSVRNVENSASIFVIKGE